MTLFFAIVTATLLNIEAEAANPNLFVSAENQFFSNHFVGSMVVEVVVRDPNLHDTDKGKGEPNVTINGKTLRMVQASDGNWYAYFANKDLAKVADQISLIGGVPGDGLDFGVFCGPNTASSVLGVSFSDSEGISIPNSAGITGTTNGESSFKTCTGSATGGASENNVVRSANSLNTNPNVQVGQIGINPNVWPVIQLFSFNDNVVIEYKRGGGTQRVELTYDEIPQINLSLDRKRYPNNAQVFVTINDIQLNQDPTSRDSWTFNIGAPTATFYQAFTESGSNSANGGPGLVNLVPNLSKLGFDENGKLTLNLATVALLQTNDHQPTSSATDGTTPYNQIVTLVESQPNSGIFESFDDGDESIIRISPTAPRGQSAVIQYNDKSTSIIAGSTTASISLNPAGNQFNPGQKATVTLVDIDQNINSGQRDDLDVFRSSATIPTMQIGSPITLEKASNLKFYTLSTDALAGGTSVSFSVPDKKSDRLLINTAPLGTTTFEKISLNLGITASELKSLFINVNNPNSFGINAINYDLRSFEKQLDISSFSDTSMILHFGGLPGTTTVQIIDPGDISSAKGLLPIDDSDITTINTVSDSAKVYLEINFDSSNNTPSTGTISNEPDTQPIVFDLFSFGEKNSNKINNAIYRFELEETSSNSGTFTGTIEYAATNQLTLFNSNLLSSLRTIDDQIKFLVNERLTNEEGINIAYSDLAEVGLTITTSLKTDIKTHSGSMYTTSPELRIGRPVVIVLNDPDLNLNNDLIDTYSVVDDPNSPHVDTVGTASGDILAEIKIKDVRYKRCTINGVEHGGLASTGFSFVETGQNTGIFEGSFKLPSQICDKSGTNLITTAGGSIDVRYHDFRDASGETNIFGLSNQNLPSPTKSTLNLNSEEFVLPKYQQTTNVVLTGQLPNYKQGTTVSLTLIGPDKSSKNLNIYATKDGVFKAEVSLYHDSIPGRYTINVSYLNSPVGSISFQVLKKDIPQWIKNNAQWWSSNQISDSEFINGIEHLIKEDIIIIPKSLNSEKTIQEVPAWIKNTAKWWSEGSVTDDEFVEALEFLIKNSIIRI